MRAEHAELRAAKGEEPKGPQEVTSGAGRKKREQRARKAARVEADAGRVEAGGEPSSASGLNCER